jgi:hypothetical protein
MRRSGDDAKRADHTAAHRLTRPVAARPAIAGMRFGPGRFANQPAVFTGAC